MPVFEVREFGGLHKPDYRMYLTRGGVPVSPFHDVPLFVDNEGCEVDGPGKGIYNMIVEIPKLTNKKFELDKRELLNPIKKDLETEEREYMWNYGAFPQTWENPDVVDKETKCKGDGDPVDVFDIGEEVTKRGSVVSVKILGVIGLIDEGKTDWKIVAVNLQDKRAASLNDIADVNKVFPDMMKKALDFFRGYKIPEGLPETKFAFNGEVKGTDTAVKLVNGCHDHWRGLIEKNNISGLACANTTLKTSPYLISAAAADSILGSQAPPC